MPVYAFLDYKKAGFHNLFIEAITKYSISIKYHPTITVTDRVHLVLNDSYNPRYNLLSSPNRELGNKLDSQKKASF